MKLAHSVLHAGAAALALFFAAPAAAQGLPDLVVNTERSKILSLSCKVAEPLAVIRIAIDNVGAGSARRATAIGLPSVAAVAAEHAPYTVQDATSRNHIDPGEIATVEIAIGAEMRKSGRIGEAVGGEATAIVTARSLQEQRRLPIALRRELQRRLEAAGYYAAAIDGIFGSRTETAIRAFQRDRREPQTGVLTIAQIDALLEGGPSRSSFVGTGRDRSVRLVVIIDPENLVPESDESNNVWITPPQLLTDC